MSERVEGKPVSFPVYFWFGLGWHHQSSRDSQPQLVTDEVLIHKLDSYRESQRPAAQCWRKAWERCMAQQTSFIRHSHAFNKVLHTIWRLNRIPASKLIL